MIRVFIADDHEFIRAGLTSILAAIPDIEVIGEAANGHDVLQALREKTPDALVLDMSMPGLSGLELIKRIKSEWPKQKILVLTMHTNKQYAVRAIRAGAAGFLSKAIASEELVAALRKIVAGKNAPTQFTNGLFGLGITDDFAEADQDMAGVIFGN